MTRTWRRVIYIFTSLFALYVVAGFFLVPWVVRNQIETQMQSRLLVVPKAEKISFNPFTFQMKIEGFQIPGPTPQQPPRLSWELFAVNLTLHPLFQKEVRLKIVEVKGGNVSFSVFKNGETNWKMQEVSTEQERSQGVSGKPWTLTMDIVRLENGSVHIEDETHDKPLQLTLGPLSLEASQISTSLGTESSIKQLSIAVGESGHIQVRGNMNLSPLKFQADVNAQGVPLNFLTALISDKTTLEVRQGFADVTGTLSYQKGLMKFLGDSSIHGVQVGEEGQDVPVLSWKTLGLQSVEFVTQPLGLSVGAVELVGVETEVVLRKDGTLNWKRFLKSSATTEPNGEAVTQEVRDVSPAPEKPFRYDVKSIVIQEGVLDYADQQIRPNFSAHVHNLNGRLGPISSEAGTKTGVELAGQVESYGKFKGHGHVVMGPGRPSLDLGMNFHNIELTTFTPYSGHFAGYEIRKGKLFLDFRYRLINNRIKGDNKVLLDQFTLGNRVESERAGNWPLKLALAMMKDRKGQIKFKLPVEGDVNSPSFSIGNLVWTAIKNMVINIVAAPFDFLASVFGGGEDLQNIQFEAGTPQLAAGEEIKIEKLAEALSDRPLLAMEIQGEYQARDVEVLQAREVEKKVTAVLKNHGGDRGRALRAVAPTVLSGEVWKNLPKDLSDQDLEKTIVSRVQVPADELKSLALQRGKSVMALLSQKKVDTERLYLLAGGQGDGTAPQVHLKLKEK